MAVLQSALLRVEVPLVRGTVRPTARHLAACFVHAVVPVVAASAAVAARWGPAAELIAAISRSELHIVRRRSIVRAKLSRPGRRNSVAAAGARTRDTAWAEARRVGVGVTADGALAGCVHLQSDPRLRAAQLRQAHLVAAALGSAGPLLCEGCGGADHQSAQRQLAERHGSIDTAKPGLSEADALQRTVMPVGLP